MRNRAPGDGRDLRAENHVGGLYSDDDQEAVSQNAIEALARCYA
jgi:hypothetical protein